MASGATGMSAPTLNRLGWDSSLTARPTTWNATLDADRIDRDLLDVITNALADSRCNPVRVCRAVASWCVSHKRPCDDPDVFRRAVAAFGFEPRRGAHWPYPFLSWRDFFYHLCEAFAHGSLAGAVHNAPFWSGMKQRLVGPSLPRNTEARAMVRTPDLTPRGLDMCYAALYRTLWDLWPHTGAGGWPGAPRLTHEDREAVWADPEAFGRAAQYQHGLPKDALVPVLNKRHPVAALYALLRLRGAHLRSNDYYTTHLDQPMYDAILDGLAGTREWPQVVERVRDLLERGGDAEYSGPEVDLDTVNRAWETSFPQLPVGGPRGEDAQTTGWISPHLLELAILSRQADLILLLMNRGAVVDGDAPDAPFGRQVMKILQRDGPLQGPPAIVETALNLLVKSIYDNVFSSLGHEGEPDLDEVVGDVREFLEGIGTEDGHCATATAFRWLYTELDELLDLKWSHP